eukprot:Colp12_sorted_trinity150504_noHs@36495
MGHWRDLLPAGTSLDSHALSLLEHLENAEKHLRCFTTHLNDFFLDNIWDLMENEWASSLETTSLETYFDFVKNAEIPDHWSLSLKKFITRCQNFTLKKETLTGLEGDEELLSKHQIGMKRKKQHEVLRMAAYIQRDMKDINYIVDLGAGQGYLSHFLAATLKVPTFAIDNNEHNTSRAIERSRKVAKRKAAGSVHHVTYHVDENMTSQELKKVLCEAAYEVRWNPGSLMGWNRGGMITTSWLLATVNLASCILLI